jgi:hypothetical protein
MAKIRAIDQALVITSELTNEQLAKASKYFPEVLTLTTKNDDGKTVPLFSVKYGGQAEAGKYGVVFPEGPKAEKASLTINIDKLSKEKRVELVKDKYGVILVNLIAVEKAYADANKAFDEQYKSLDANIVVE